MNILRSPFHWITLFIAIGNLAAAQTPTQPVAPATPPQGAVLPKSYPEAQVERGEKLFRQDCSFCHGRDAMGGESGPNLTRSRLVRADVDGDKIGPVIRNGRLTKGMP